MRRYVGWHGQRCVVGKGETLHSYMKGVCYALQRQQEAW